MIKGRTIALIGVIGVLSYLKFGDSFKAEGDESNGSKTIIERIKERFNPSQLEQITTERTGMTVDTIPIDYSPSSSQAGHFAFDKTVTYVNDAPFGPGVSDVKISIQDPYNYNLSAEDFHVFNAVAPGQDIIAPPIAQLHSIQPTSYDVCCKPVTSFAGSIQMVENVSSRAALPQLQTSNEIGTMSPDINDIYTNGTDTKSLAQWMQEGQVDMRSRGQETFRSHLGGVASSLRRV